MVFKSNAEISIPTAWGGTESQAIRYSKGGTAVSPPPTYLAFIIAFIWGLSPVLFKFFLHQSVPTYLIIFFQAFVYLISSVIYMLIFTEIQELYTIFDNYAIFFCVYCRLLVYLCTGKQREYYCNGNNYNIGSGCNNDIFLLYFPRNVVIKGVHWIFYYSCRFIAYFYWMNIIYLQKKYNLK